MRLTSRFAGLAAIGFMLTLGTLARSEDDAHARAAKWASAMIERREAIRSDQKGLPRQSPWQATPPQALDTFDKAGLPEKTLSAIALDAKLPDGKPLWTPRPAWRDGAVVPLNVGGHTATYLYRTIDCPSAMKMTANFGSDDGIMVWLNGARIHANNAARGAAPDQDPVALDLKAGPNQLLVKIYNQSGNSGFYYSLGASKSADLQQVADAFPQESRWFKQYVPNSGNWLDQDKDTQVEQNAIAGLLGRLKDPQPQRAQLDQLIAKKAPATDAAWLTLFAASAARVQGMEDAATALQRLNFDALASSIRELSTSYPDKYKNGPAHLQRLEELRKQAEAVQKAIADKDDKVAGGFAEAYENLRRQALVLENPLIDFDSLLLVRREADRLGLPQNWQSNSSLNPRLQNEIARLNIKAPSAALQTVYKPAQPLFVGDLNLHFDGDRMLFSSIGSNGRWQIFEVKADGTGLTQVTPGDHGDIDNYNGIYLPDGRIVYTSNSGFLGVPCVGGGDYVANLHLLSADRKDIRQLTFDQDNDWYPTLLANGRIMYLRWEYTDSAHYFSRVLMSMNPDGTNQIEYYGSNSYWPNGVFYAKPCPGTATKFVGIVSGHHGVPRMGELVLFDQSLGRKENSGAIQRIPGHGKPVQDLIKDTLVDGSWPKFLHPVPLSDKYFIVSAKPTPDANWGIYLVDAFDNMVLLREEPGYALLEPIPLRKTPAPPVVPDKVDLARSTATVLIQDIYTGQALRGVPRGTVKSLRLFQYEYAYRNTGGHYSVGIEGPWDVRRIIGTVPVNEDGSAFFEIPANVPLSLQPLDAEGKALQQKRSWFVGMPGERLSCVGCHDIQNNSVPVKASLASRATPVTPKPWYGPKRGFSFLREVQPVLDKYCIGCHDGREGRPNLSDTSSVHTSMGGSFPKSYVAIHPFVRRNGPEGDYTVLTPLEFHADTSDLVQMLNKGHHNVKLDAEAWDRLITWIDLNVPAHGTWREIGNIPGNFEKRRYEMKKLYANVDEDIEAVINPYKRTETFIQPPAEAAKPAPIAVPGWPFSADRAREMQTALGEASIKVDLGGGKPVELRRIPAGEFEMGDLNGYPDEYPTARVTVAKPFWMASTEISLEQYRQFKPQHRNGYYDMHYKDQVKPGYLMDDPAKPVIRVSWQEAMEFCAWLSQKTGKKVTLPTEAQWEWACRAGAGTPFWYGDLNTDFSTFANLGDRTLKKLAVSGVDPQPIANPDAFWDFVPKDARFDDGTLHLADVGHYKPNAWGLGDMHGNVAEWTRSTYRAYPYDPSLEASADSPLAKKTVRGGSWYDRPKHARAGFRQAYPAWQKVYNVGFRIIIED